MKMKNILVVLFISLTFIQCENKNSYMDEPSWLEVPIYQLLKENAQFSNFLTCVDRTNYASLLQGGGLYTVFAPNNEAFAKYLSLKGYSSLGDIPQDEVNSIVAYSMVFSSWESEHLGDVFTGTSGNLFLSGHAFKRKTNYYAAIYQDPDFGNKWVIDQNELNAYNTSKFNFKYLPVFTQSYLNYTGITAADYNVFFPETRFVGGNSIDKGILANVYDGQIVTPDFIARNGVVHEVSTVNYPLDNMEKVLRGSQFSVMKSLLDLKTLSGSYVFKQYTESSDLTERYKQIASDKNIDKVYVKNYNTTDYLYFSPALELYDGSVSETEQNGYTLFVPTNEALSAYVTTKLLKYYSSLQELPVEAVTTFINTHMADGMIWPSKFKTEHVSTDEYVNGVGAAGSSYENFGVLDKQITSNGIIYTIDHVLKSKLFETIYSEIFLNPNYSFLNNAYNLYFSNSLKTNLMKSPLTGHPNVKYTILLPPNALWKQDGFSYDETLSTFSNPLLISTTAATRLSQLIRMHVVEGYKDNTINTELSSFSSGGISDYNGWNFRNTQYGDVIRFKNNTLQASGNIEDKTYVHVTPVGTYDNGTVFSVDKLLQYSTRETTPSSATGWNVQTLWHYLSLAATENPQVSSFVRYVQLALKASDSEELSGISEEYSYTVLMVNNSIMTRAIANGDLPTEAQILANATGAKDKAANFLKAHFLQGQAYPDDRLPYIFPYSASEPNKSIVSTMYRVTDNTQGIVSQRTSVVVSKNADGTLLFTPQNVVNGSNVIIKGSMGTTTQRLITGKAANGDSDSFRSNRIAGRSVLHEFYSYFKFGVVQN